LKRTNGNLELLNYGILEKYGHLERVNDAIQTSSFKLLEESTALLLKQLIQNSKVDQVPAYLSLPNFSGFVSLVEFPLLPEKELAKAVRYQAPQYLPLALEEMTLDWQVIETSTDKMKVLLMAVPTEVIKRYVKTAELAKVNLKGFRIRNDGLGRI